MNTNTAYKTYKGPLKSRLGWVFQSIGKHLPFSQFLFAKTSIPYTFLFRDVEEYRDRLIDFGKKNGPINILNVGCASGQEAYSIIAVCQDAGIDCSITAVDINADAVAVAKAGIYDWDKEKRLAMNNADTPEVSEESLKWLSQCERYFEKTTADNTMTDPRKVLDSVSEQVSFKLGNLAELSFEKEFDFVVCRKMLYYLPPSIRNQALENMFKALKIKDAQTQIIFDPYTLSQPFVIDWLNDLK